MKSSLNQSAIVERKEPDGHDIFFNSLNQLILSLESAIKKAGSVAATEDILTHLEATDDNSISESCHILFLAPYLSMCFLLAKL